VLDYFGVFWRTEENPKAKREILQLIFERLWLDATASSPVRPREAFAPFFLDRNTNRLRIGVFRTGATGSIPRPRIEFDSRVPHVAVMR
jgi:hypothetical protein